MRSGWLTSGVACSFDFDLGKIEDIKSCIAEACILLMCAQTCEFLNIYLECSGEIRAQVSAAGAARVSPGEECVGIQRGVEQNDDRGAF